MVLAVFNRKVQSFIRRTSLSPNGSSPEVLRLTLLSPLSKFYLCKSPSILLFYIYFSFHITTPIWPLYIRELALTDLRCVWQQARESDPPFFCGIIWSTSTLRSWGLGHSKARSITQEGSTEQRLGLPRFEPRFCHLSHWPWASLTPLYLSFLTCKMWINTHLRASLKASSKS